MSRELPYFRWYPADAESDFAYSCFSSSELGVFHRALNAAWTNDGLPNDETAIGRALRLTVRDMKESWPNVRAMFYVGEDGKLRNKRQEEERTHATTKSERNTKAVRTRYERTSQDLPGSPAEVRAQRLRAAQSIARHSEKEWKNLLEDCGSCCVKCGDKTREILKDHIVPLYKGGSDGIENLQPLCSKCNASKGPDTTDYRTYEVRSKYVRNTNELQHARARAESECVSESVFGSKEITSLQKKRAADILSPTSQRWPEFLERYPMKVEIDAAAQEFISVVTVENEEQAFACLARYLASDQVKRGIVMKPANWLRQQNRDGWLSEWPGAVNGNGHHETRAQRLAREMEEEGRI